MIVADASALLEFLLQTPLGRRVEPYFFDDAPDLHAPHLVDVEVAQALRRLVRAGELTAARAQDALADLVDLDLERHPHVDLLPRAWTLRDNLTAYDAMYVVLADALDATLVTCDGPLARAPVHRARVVLID